MRRQTQTERSRRRPLKDQDAAMGVLAMTGAGFCLLRAILQPILFSARNCLSIVLTIVFLIGAALRAAASLVHPQPRAKAPSGPAMAA